MKGMSMWLMEVMTMLMMKRMLMRNGTNLISFLSGHHITPVNCPWAVCELSVDYL